MSLRTARLVFLIVLVGGPTSVGAHRLDEYLQATRVAVGLNRVMLDIDLTPGVSVARQIIASIDTDQDGQISATERQAYVEQVLKGLSLSVDGRNAPLTLVDSSFPDIQAMTAGVGTVRLHATASIPAAASGHHRLDYVNTHRPDTSVYLANALVPDDERVRIVLQRRDRAQHGLSLEYDVARHPLWLRTSWLLAGFATLALLAGARRVRVSPVATSASRRVT